MQPRPRDPRAHAHQNASASARNGNRSSDRSPACAAFGDLSDNRNAIAGYARAGQPNNRPPNRHCDTRALSDAGAVHHADAAAAACCDPPATADGSAHPAAAARRELGSGGGLLPLVQPARGFHGFRR